MDQEWVKLISEARSLGFKKEEISAFLKGKALRQHLRRTMENRFRTNLRTSL
ncbi:anti-repressor SinI family protein [Peribacillus frigoritolerans]|nr:anti-repressor SinI family protein [Peribacillus frigoritolerans]